jgi:hypothetical protein
MASTPVEYVGLKTAIGWLRKYGKEALEYGKRIATLEARVKALEDQLKAVPPDACLFCGERAMRLTKRPSMVKGSRPNLWTEEVWTCGACTKTYTKHIAL